MWFFPPLYVDYAFLEYFEGPIPLSGSFISCNLLATPKALMPGIYTFIVQKESPFEGILNHYLNYLKEKGLYNKMELYYKSEPQGISRTAAGINGGHLWEFFFAI